MASEIGRAKAGVMDTRGETEVIEKIEEIGVKEVIDIKAIEESNQNIKVAVEDKATKENLMEINLIMTDHEANLRRLVIKFICNMFSLF